MRGLEDLQREFDALLSLPPAQCEARLQQLCELDPEWGRQLRHLIALDGMHEDADEPVPAIAWSASESLEDVLVPGYRLLRQIGAGGMGRVFAAVRRDDPLQIVRALKTVRNAAANPLLIQRFELECEALASLSHPGIARLIDAGKCQDGSPFVVMEFVDGEPIDAWCDRRKLGLRARIELVRQLVAAVQHAHQQLIIHRDIKAANVLVDEDGRVTLVDFGIAKSLLGTDYSHTATAERFLSPRSAAPEQLLGGVVGTACDIHGIGLLLYGLLCGREPFDFDGADPLRIQEQVLRIPAPGMVSRLQVAGEQLAANRGASSIAELRAALGGDLEQVVLRCLRKKPQERYPDVHSLDRDLQSLLQDRPISERENETWYRLKKFVSRHRVGVGLAAITGALLLVALAVVIQQRQHALHQQARAESAMGILLDSFAAANPLNNSGGQTRVSEVLDAAKPLLEARRVQQPELFAELATSIAQVELSSGRPGQALTLTEQALAAARHAGEDESELVRPRIIHARAALESGHLEGLDVALSSIAARTIEDTVETQILQGRLAYLQDNVPLAISRLERAFALTNALPADHPLTLDARTYLAQAYRQDENAGKALTLLEEGLLRLQGLLPASHPRMLVLRMRQLEYARRVKGSESVLDDVVSLVREVERAFGVQSAVTARARGNLAQVYLDLGRSAEAITHFRGSWRVWTDAASAGHSNTLRSLFNLTYALIVADAPFAEVDGMFRRLMQSARTGTENNPRIVGYWQVSHLHYLMENRACQATADAFQAYFSGGSAAELSPEARLLLDKVVGHYRDSCGCSGQADTAICSGSADRGTPKAGPAIDAG
jgi:serine/threonine-protein kinase